MKVSAFGSLVLVFCVAAAFGGIVFASVSWVLVTIAVASVFVYARLRFIHELDHTSLEVERTVLDKMVFAGAPVSVKVQIINRNPDPVLGVVEDLIPEDAEVASGTNKVATALKPRTIESFTYSLKLARRGPNQFRGLKIERADPFGLFEEEQVFGEGFSVNAHAKKESYDTARKMAGREHFEYSGVSKAPAAILREQEFNGIRDYVPGDRARDIYWKGLAKTGQLMTKTYTKEGSLRTTIFLDCTRSMRLANELVSKLDHAVELSMQLSSVLISSYHPTGLSMFDEMSIINETSPALGRHQFQTIVQVLRNAPPSIRTSGEGAHASAANVETPVGTRVREDERFLSAVSRILGRESGLESTVKELIAKGRNQQQLFVVISDLGSSRNAVLTSAKLAQRSKNRMLVIHTYDDWYTKAGGPLDAAKLEQMYGNLSGFMRVEAGLRRAGASYMRVGPADTASRIVRSIRRGLV